MLPYMTHGLRVYMAIIGPMATYRPLGYMIYGRIHHIAMPVIWPYSVYGHTGYMGVKCKWSCKVYGGIWPYGVDGNTVHLMLQMI